MKVKSKIWLEHNGQLLLGEGKARLLHAIEESGSISKAAESLNMNYRKAWSHIKVLEERFGQTFIELKKGGKNGGGAFLTEKGRLFLGKYEMLKKEVTIMADQKFNEIFIKKGRK